MGCDTHRPWPCSSFSGCFNPRTRVGCDPLSSGSGQRPAGFQSTHPRGVRRALHFGTDRINKVSIHAPAWGATLPWYPYWYSWSCFNPRTRVGCDAMSLSASPGSASFNPRTRVGCDRVQMRVSFHQPVSIHAPAWGATRRRIWTCRLILVSIHAPAWGATKELFHGFTRRHVSIHAPAWGATSNGTIVLRPSNVFQSTHPRGVRHAPSSRIAPNLCVSIHAPAWGATAKIADPAR